MGGTEHGERTRELAREAVRRLAPHELELFEETADVYFEDPAGTLARARPEPLGIGLEVVAAGAWTLFALPVAASVAGNLATEALREGRGRRWWPRRRARSDGAAATEGPPAVPDPQALPGPAAPAELAAADLELIHRVAVGRGLALGLPVEQARLLADAIVGGVVTGRNRAGSDDGHAPGGPETGAS
ncbi:hypothetical protein ACFV1L_19070 [Kitasatospora sp. NPDC059646]|uniref:hypothetical protein n=1 Tax=Kitasatospora sp. NPDC059646 TaxID=3346893 RepID=UPI0036888D93